MIRQLMLTVAAVAVLAAATNTADARNFFNRQADVEPLPVPATPYQQVRFAPAQKMPYQAVQKMPYQVVQKGAFQAVQKTPYQAVQKMPYQAYQKGAYQKGAYQKGTVATCVRYVQHCPHRKTCCDCGSSYQTVLTVIDPNTCCPVDVPVCLPSCCTGQPLCSARHGLLGRGITSYSWCCGYTVRIVIGIHGDVTVHYYGV